MIIISFYLNLFLKIIIQAFLFDLIDAFVTIIFNKYLAQNIRDTHIYLLQWDKLQRYTGM